MSTQKIEPNKVTKPIQLVAAWLVGLILVNGAFLGTAMGIGEPTWLKGTLVIASVINVPVFLGAIFLLQTKFRPQLQEDEYYSQYLDKSTSEYVSVSKDENILSEISEIKSELITLSELKNSDFNKIQCLVEKEKTHPWPSHYKIALCDYLPDFKAIRKELKDSNISISKIFGTANTKNIPKINHLSYVGDTTIGKNTFLDNHIHIAHNVKIGENCMLAAQVGISGSTIIGNNVMIGGQAGIAGHLKIGNGVKIGGASGVTTDLADNSKVMGYPAMPMREFARLRNKIEK